MDKIITTDELKIGSFFSLKKRDKKVYLTDHHMSKEITIDMAIDIMTFLIKNFDIKVGE